MSTSANASPIAMTTNYRHREERSDVAIQGRVPRPLDCFGFASQ